MERNSNKGLKKLVLLLLLFVGLGASVTAGAYWASSFTAADATSPNGELTVTIGQGGVVRLNTTLTLGKQVDEEDLLDLVPTSYKDDVTSTDTRVITISASWTVASEQADEEYTNNANNDLNDKASGKLNANIIGFTLKEKELTPDEEIEINNMFTVNVISKDVSIKIGQSASINVEVVFKNEPSTKDLYDKVANGTLTIEITLTVTANVAEE